MVGHGTDRMIRIPAEQFCKTLCLVTESNFHGHGPYIGIAPVAQWIRRLPTEQEILGSLPGGGTSFNHL
jgi:hypothetical protein